MKYKNNFFSILEKIEKMKLEENGINIRHLILKEKKNIDQLNILINYKKEYLQRMHKEMISGICLPDWENYNHFISMLDNTIQDNIYFIKNNKKIIAERLQQWSKNQTKLYTWIYLNKINKKKILQRTKVREQNVNSYYVQLKWCQKDKLLLC